MSCQNILSPKSPDARVGITFDFTGGLEAGEQLTSVVSRSVSVIAGIDIDPTLMWSGQPIINIEGTMVQQEVLAGLDGCFYQFTVVIDTNLRRLTLSAVLPVSSTV